jgi:pyridoxal phosphate enzyme (YggS family)
MSELAERYGATVAAIAERAKQASRVADEITLIVVSKNHGPELVRELHSLGQRDFGENRDQEAKPKAEQTQDLPGINWHFVGQLQSNKVRSALSYSRIIHSIDRPSLLSSIQKELVLQNSRASGFIQLNLTDDPGRGGVQPKDLLDFAEKALEVSNLEILGVMGVAALDRDPRIDFETIAAASQSLRGLIPSAKSISAGMSHDFKEAIDFGATHLRIGTVITGKRNL